MNLRGASGTTGAPHNRQRAAMRMGVKGEARDTFFLVGHQDAQSSAILT